MTSAEYSEVKLRMKLPFRNRQRGTRWICFLLMFMLMACTPKAATSLTEVFPDATAFADWRRSEELAIYDRETIFELVNGQADFFFVYGFEQVAVGRYEHAAGSELDIEIWQLATAADAYGLFTASIAGEPVDIGSAGDADPGRRVAFWQDRYTVQVRARQELDDAVLRDFAVAISAQLPPGGEKPAIVARAPSAHLVPRSVLFFHEELSIQNELWLGGENILGLSPQTDGVLARYDLDGTLVRLLLVQYPDAQAATAGRDALRASQVGELAAVEVRGDLLGAVFGAAEGTLAEQLLTTALVAE